MAYRRIGLETGYYGNQVVVYVAIEVPGRKPSKHFVVYGHAFTKVMEVVRKALKDKFGLNGAGNYKHKKKRKK